ncbi:MAG: DNA repair protein RadA [Acidimicrobiia bacterium]|nr:DNA repair protein RadA [Acidimicrobiia bacterium]
MTFRCGECGYRSGKWMGFCPQCRSDLGLIEDDRARSVARIPVPTPLQVAGNRTIERARIGIGEVDRVLGGGLVPGSVVLVGGEPGVGKSTLLLQVAGSLADAGGKVLVATAEESEDQVGLRARRLSVATDNVFLLAEEDVDSIIAAAGELRPDLLIVDSVQAVSAAEVGSGPGSIAQVRECGARLTRFAKERNVAVILVGHVTKDGGIAGPKLLEHMVDVVLYLEGESEHGLRTLRSLKNRFGATHVVGLFEMATVGLVEVDDPSAVFLAGWRHTVAGSVVVPAVQGRRPVLVEVQALVAPTKFVQPRRSTRGIESARLHQLIAVLARHGGIPFYDREVYVGLVGGLRIAEPAIDLPLALALVSSLLDKPLGRLAAWGEVGLTGEIRSVPHESRRREEANRLGVERIVAPSDVSSLAEALEWAGLLPDGGHTPGR